jgi:hypothetical protein
VTTRPFLLLGICVVLCEGCAGLGYTGAARELSVAAIESEPGWVAVRGVPLYRQQGDHDCGSTALAMVLRYWDVEARVQHLLDRRDDERLSAADLRSLARDAGFDAFVIEGTVEDLVPTMTGRRASLERTTRAVVRAATRSPREVVAGRSARPRASGWSAGRRRATPAFRRPRTARARTPA